MDKKYKKLLISILLDGVGMISFFIPGLGEFIDIVWAPLSGQNHTFKFNICNK